MRVILYAMASPYVGEIRIFAGNFPPLNWAFCDGSILSIAENETLFQLIGTTYGGDGQVTFALPDLRGRIPVHLGTGPGLATVQIGEVAGQETVTLTTATLPAHTHAVQVASAVGHLASPEQAFVAAHRDDRNLGGVADTAMAGGVLAATGGNQPHENMPPFLGVSFIISLFGIFPSPA